MSKPFIKWVGGKRQLLPELRKHLPASLLAGTFGGWYFEPFLGGGALYWDLQPKSAVLSDVNLRLMKTWRAVRSCTEDLVERLREMPNTPEFHQRMRDKDIDAETDEAEIAAWFIYLNKTSFNGLYRVNKKGGFNAPFGKYKNPAICDEETLLACGKALREARVSLDNRFFDLSAGDASKGDFVYFDPPYVPLTESASFTAYDSGGFDHNDQVRLRDLALRLKAKGVRVVLSNSDTPVVRELYKGSEFLIHSVSAKRAINCQAGKRGPVGEVIVT